MLRTDRMDFKLDFCIASFIDLCDIPLDMHIECEGEVRHVLESYINNDVPSILFTKYLC